MGIRRRQRDRIPVSILALVVHFGRSSHAVWKRRSCDASGIRLWPCELGDPRRWHGAKEQGEVVPVLKRVEKHGETWPARLRFNGDLGSSRREESLVGRCDGRT
jgi:hypothetical protein